MLITGEYVAHSKFYRGTKWSIDWWLRMSGRDQRSYRPLRVLCQHHHHHHQLLALQQRVTWQLDVRFRRQLTTAFLPGRRHRCRRPCKKHPSLELYVCVCPSIRRTAIGRARAPPPLTVTYWRQSDGEDGASNLRAGDTCTSASDQFGPTQTNACSLGPLLFSVECRISAVAAVALVGGRECS